MSRYAVISDIHGNLFALEAVLARLADFPVDGLLCLGDIVGYGPEPGACLDLINRYCSVIVQGNHDQAAVDPVTAEQFNGPAREAIMWTRGQLSGMHLNALLQLKTRQVVDGKILCIHDCPVPAPTDYVHDKVMAAMAFTGVEVPVCLLGHTHVPMVFEAPSMDATVALGPADIVGYLPRDGEPIAIESGRRYICNPGSVGQPRDADPRASFAIIDLDAGHYTMHRQEYDIDAAQMATQRAGLPFILAERLAVGA